MLKCRNYIVCKSTAELTKYKKCDLAVFLIYQTAEKIFIYEKHFGKWTKRMYSFSGDEEDIDLSVTGFTAYRSFYNYLGKEEVDRIKSVSPKVTVFESEEQLHFYNPEFAEKIIKEEIYELDANSAFTYGVMQLSSDFDKLKEYFMFLYEKKKNAKTKKQRSRYKNLQNFLIGYFARVKDLYGLRSKIIENSNNNIRRKMAEIVKNGGKVFISSTDSIVTDRIGYEVMKKYISEEVGFFKVKTVTDKLYYKSSNCYQLGDKVVYSGKSYFERINTNFIDGIYTKSEGRLLNETDFLIETSNDIYKKLCIVSLGEILVRVYNNEGNLIRIHKYKLEEK